MWAGGWVGGWEGETVDPEPKLSIITPVNLRKDVVAKLAVRKESFVHCVGAKLFVQAGEPVEVLLCALGRVGAGGAGLHQESPVAGLRQEQFPGGLGKHPLHQWGETTSTSPDDARRWWAHEAPHGPNVALLMVGGLLAIDVDGPAGEASLAAAVDVLGPLPPTLENVTGRTDGGRHLLFSVPADASARDVAALTKSVAGMRLDGVVGKLMVVAADDVPAVAARCLGGRRGRRRWCRTRPPARTRPWPRARAAAGRPGSCAFSYRES